MVGRVEVRSCIQMSLMYRSNSYIVHHCWFWARTMEFAFSLFRRPHHHHHILLATTLRLCVFITTERFILNDKRLSYSQWFYAFFSKIPRKIALWFIHCGHHQRAIALTQKNVLYIFGDHCFFVENDKW